MGCPDGSGTKKEIVHVLIVHIPAYLSSRGKPFFLN